MTENFGLVYATGIARQFSSCFSEAMVDLDVSGTYSPHLAESWDIDMDAHTITFYLRQGLHFTDGSPINAESVVWNFDAWHDENRGNEEVGRGMSEAID
jgi:ABC-type transport system substrate-binding protein